MTMQQEVSLNTPIRYLKGVGPKKEKIFNRLGIIRVKDALYYFPFRYEDRRNLTLIKELKEKEAAFIKVKALAKRLRRLKFRKSIFEVAAADASGVIYLVWFNQPYLNKQIKTGDTLIAYGKPVRYRGRLQIVAPEYELVEGQMQDYLSLERIVPIYHLSKGISQRRLRNFIYEVINKYSSFLEDPLPFDIRSKEDILNISQSFFNIHFPQDFDLAQKARERFIFEELFFSQILVSLRKEYRRRKKGISFSIDDKVVAKVMNNFSFTLTGAQQRVIKDFFSDMKAFYPMRRLLQGDVGCGKTVAVSFALAICAANKYQAAVMVPTEILAYQHFQTFSGILKGCGYKIELLIGSMKSKQKDECYKRLSQGSTDIVIGTHALLQEKLLFKKLGLVVIDEQHKFGAGQRALLPKKGINPDCIIMSATPIPRSLALSLYGDLDLSVIDQLPPGRKAPKTMLIKEQKRKWLYDFIKKEIKEGRQAYIVYPFIDSTEQEEDALEKVFLKLKKEFRGYKLAKLFGRQPSEEKIKAIDGFKSNKVNILVSTSVVEVGVNVTNVNIMVVEGPERFGLAQLHQLRGRIMRSNYQPYFFLLEKENLSSPARQRLKIITSTTDGFKIAEEDLRLRGPGDFFGELQHGLPHLKIAHPLRDLDILKRARKRAKELIAKDSSLSFSSHRCIRRYLQDYFNAKRQA